VRRLGWLQLFAGLFLVALMGTITYNLAPLMLRAGERAGGARFTGTAEQAQLILGLFGLVIAFGLASMLSGLWHIKTGRRNKWIFFLLLGLVAVLGLITVLVEQSLGG
jgi:MFS family permease